MKIQYCSDLHLEFGFNKHYLAEHPLPVCGDVLLLAGDIASLEAGFAAEPFLKFAAENFEKVFWVPGNHEFYYRNIGDFGQSYQIDLGENIHLVHNVDMVHRDVRFVFSTLWSEIKPANAMLIEQRVADFKCITLNNKRLKAADFNQLHAGSRDFLKQALSTYTDKTVVVTHHLPSGRCNSAEHDRSPINEAFCTELTDLVEQSKARFWIHGHSHYNHTPIIIGETLVLTNQLGYVQQGEHQSFRPNAWFSI